MDKYLFLRTTVAAAVLLSGVAQANPATVTFNGEVTSTTCTLVAGSKTGDLIFPDLTTQQIAASSGWIADTSGINLQLTSCPVGVTKVILDNASTTGTRGSYDGAVIPEGGTGSGIELEVLTTPSTGKDSGVSMGVRPFGPGQIADLHYEVSSGTASVPLKAHIRKNTNIPINAGDFNTTMTVSFTWS